MLTITETIPDFDTYEDYLGYHGETALFFDIETSGLSPASAIVFLIGAVRKVGGSWQLTQWLAQRPEDEPQLLRAFSDAAAGCDTLIHFNGTTFDLPFLKERTRLLGLAKLPEFSDFFDLEKVPESNGSCGCEKIPKSNGSCNCEKIPKSNSSCGCEMLSSRHSVNGRNSLDLYRKFRPLKQPLGLSRMNQTTLEQFLGWPREDRLSGKHMISLFQKYTVSQEPMLADLLLLHNHDDLLGMTGLLRLCAYSMLFEGQFAAVSASLARDNSGVEHGEHGETIDMKAPIEKVTDCTESSRDRLLLCLTLKAALPQEITLSIPCAFPQCNSRNTDAPTGFPQNETSDSDSNLCPNPGVSYTLGVSGTQAILSVPGFCGELRHFFPNHRDYYYLPLEDQAVHKSVAAFVDPQCRTRATAANCYIKKSGLFFPQPEESFTPAFKASCDSRELFFACPQPENTPQLPQMPGQHGEMVSELSAESKATPSLNLEQEQLASYTASLLRMFAHGS